MGAAKKQEEPLLELVDLPTDREQGLSRNFEDPQLDEVFSGPAEPSPVQLVKDVAEAVHELHIPDALPLPADAAADDVAVSDTPLPENFGALPIPDSMPEPEAPVASPRPLPASVNPIPDPLDRSTLLSMPADFEQTSAKVLEAPLGAGAVARDPNASFRMAESIFALVACEKSFDDMVNQALRAIMEAVGAYAGSVLELDHEHEDFFFRAAHGGTSSVTQLKAFRVPLTKGIVGHVAESGEPLLISDLGEDQMQMRAISMSVGFEARTCLAAPILVGGQPYGVIELFNRNDGGLFDKTDLHVLEEGVRMLAKTLEVRFLLAELSRRLRS